MKRTAFSHIEPQDPLQACKVLEASLKSRTVTLLGPYPPPYGGVSIHIRRLHRRLLRAGLESRVYCQSERPGDATDDRGITPMPDLALPFDYLWFFLYPGRPVERGIVHCHDSWMCLSPSLLRLHALGRRVVITVHDQRDGERWAGTTPLLRFACRLLVRQRDVQWIAVSGNIRNQLVSHGVNPDAVTIIPAFIPLEREEMSSCPLPRDIASFCAAHRPVMSIYGFRYWIDNGLDLYGFDMAIEALRTLRVQFPSMGLVICVPDPCLMEYHRSLKKRVEGLGLGDSVLFVTRPLPEAYPLWAASTVYLRPTSTDGDAIAVRESLSVGTPVVASDAAPRPEGTIIFPARDQGRFLDAIAKALGNGTRDVNGPEDQDSGQSYTRILRVYARAADGFTRKEGGLPWREQAS